MRHLNALTGKHDKEITSFSKIISTPLNLTIINAIEAGNDTITAGALQAIAPDSAMLTTQINGLLSAGIIRESHSDEIIKYSLDKNTLTKASISLMAFFEEIESLRINAQPLSI